MVEFVSSLRSTAAGYNFPALWKTIPEVMEMAKAGMRRPDPKDPHGTESNRKTNIPRNDVRPVPEMQGKAKSGKVKASPSEGR